MAEAPSSQTQTIVFFDGICHLCNGFVDFAISRDARRALQFAPLQGETAKRLLPETDRAALSSVLVLENGQMSRESTAVARVLVALGGGWRLLGRGLLLIPSPVRDGLYRWVARNRLAWFGERDFCRLPSPGERDRLLD